VLAEERQADIYLLKEVCAVLPRGWQYPENAACRISYGTLETQTSNFDRSPWSQRAEFRTEDGTPGAIEIVYRSRPGTDGRVLCHWEIRDRGPGLTPQEAAAMFRMWHRGSESSGSGLGLAIVQGLVGVMGGTLEATQRSGGGLSVHVRLPMDAAAEIAAPPSGPTAVKDLAIRGARILVAEDDRTNQIVIRRQLENLGCIPTVVADGREALDAMAGGSFDMVLLDCQMPVLDGYATCREIRRLETENGTARQPILAVTAWAMQSDKDRCFESGMDQVLTKPLRAAELAEALRKWLPKTVSD
jgi:CheY-like chemotaxis protein